VPYKLIAPKAGRSPYWRVRGTEFGTYLDRSTQTSDRREAARFLKLWREEAERSALSGPVRPDNTFALAADAYMNAGHDRRFLAPLIAYFKDTPIDDIDQAAIDNAAASLYPKASAATRNRQVYSPVSAILKRAGVEKAIRRPKGWRSRPRPHWMSQESAMALLEAATATDVRLGALLTFLLYCGPRLSEALRLTWADVDLSQATAILGKTKNGSPIALHLPPAAIASLANLPRDRKRVFGMSKSGRLYALLAKAEAKAGIEQPPGAAFHILRHTHAMWRRQFTRADTTALVGTGLWRSRQAAAIYEHVETTEEARKSDLFPTPSLVKSGGKRKK